MKELSKKRISGWNALIYAILAAASLICIFPFYYVLIVSFADPIALLNQPVYILPYSFNLESYKVLMEEGTILGSAVVSVFVTGIGTFASVMIITMAGYALSKKRLPMRRFLLSMVLITMFVGAQTIPYYLLIRGLGLMNSIWVLVIPMLMDAYYLIIMKNYFLGVPASLEESARIDGANDYTILFRIVVPTSTPVIASVALFLAVNKWNEWWHAMLFISNKSIWPMQMMLREILASLNNSGMSAIGKLMASKSHVMNPQNVRMAAIMVTAIPILMVYPFVQKYFTTGLLIGSMKE